MRHHAIHALVLILLALPAFASELNFPLGSGGGGSGDITQVWGCTTGDCSGLTAASGDTMDASGGDSVIPWIVETSDPGTCSEGEAMYNSTDNQAHVCSATDTWTELGGDPGFDQITGATNTSAAMVVGTGASLAASGSGTIAATSSAVATALAADPADCGSNEFANAIAASGALTCAAIADADVPDDITIDLAAAASALAANPDDCSSNEFATAIAANGNLTCAALTDADVPDTITASSYLPLAGGTMTGQIVADNLGVEFEDSDTNPTCSAGNYNVFADLSETSLKKCVNGTATAIADGGAAATAAALASDPSDCSSNQFANAIAADGDLTCAQPAFSDLSGAATDSQVPDDITIDLAATATALAANPDDCSSNEFANAIAASGNLTCAAIADADVPDTITIDEATTATALAANGGNCSAGEAAGGVDASGAAESCIDPVVDLGSDPNGTLPIANGGTAGTSNTTGFNNLAPTTSTGDLIYHNGTNNVRLAIGSTDDVLTVVSGAPAWQAPPDATWGDGSDGDFDLSNTASTDACSTVFSAVPMCDSWTGSDASAGCTCNVTTASAGFNSSFGSRSRVEAAVYNFSSFTLGSDHTILFNRPTDTAGTYGGSSVVLRVTGDVTIAGTIDLEAEGNPGSTGTGTTQNAAGEAGCPGGVATGGNGGAAGAANAGVDGGDSALTYAYGQALTWAMFGMGGGKIPISGAAGCQPSEPGDVSPQYAGAGGGGGGAGGCSGSGGNSSASGDGGGGIAIFARGDLTTTNGTIDCDGESIGGTTSNNPAAGGGAGSILLVYGGSLSESGATYSVTGGTGGTTGAQCGGGGDGGDGAVVKVPVGL